MTKLKLFAASLIGTICVLLALIYVNRPLSTYPELVPVGDDLFITSQLSPKSVRFLKRKGVVTLVDLRPDGEASDQPSSSVIEAASRAYGMNFHYIPVPHENIPDKAVAQLSDVLTHRTKLTVLYCRSGKRAARTLALAEASRTGGPDTDAICEMVRGAGFSADDLREQIGQRVSHRDHSPTNHSDGSISSNR